MAVAFAFLVNWNAVQDIWQPDGTFGINGPEREICGIINTMDVEDVIVAAGSGTTEICGALDPSHRYITFAVNGGKRAGHFHLGWISGRYGWSFL